MPLSPARFGIDCNGSFERPPGINRATERHENAIAFSGNSQELHEIAAHLLAASPVHAAEFACAMHERACWGYDDELCQQWEAVLRLVLCAHSKSTVASLPAHRL